MFLIIILLNVIKKNAKNYSMWQNIKSVTAFMCILVYIGAAAFAGVSVYNAVNEQRFEARQEFAELTDFAARAGALGFFTKEYIEDIRVQLDMSPAIDALIIDGPNGRAAFEKKNSLISYNDNHPDFNRKAWLHGEPQTAQFRTDGGIAASISALSPLVDFNALLSTARLSFLAILVAVTLAFAMLIADVSIVKSTVPPITPSAEEAAVDTSGWEAPVEASGWEAVVDASAEEAAVYTSGGSQQDEHEELEELEGVEDDDRLDEYEELEELEGVEDDDRLDEYEELEELEGVEDNDRLDEYEELEELDDETPLEKNTAGAGLLAAASALNQSGTGEETEFPATLQQELDKAEKTGGDLTVLSVEGTNEDFPPEALIKQAAGFFKTGSRFFEKNDRTGVYIIVPNAGLDEIFAAAKDFYRRTDSEATVYGAELLIGMSARSTRNVDGANLLNEAESALSKARSDRTLPIVGFRVDPKKYKDFIDRQRFSA
jgi:hypothetical protein